jgi:uncharacterized DUF497 family protein
MIDWAGIEGFDWDEGNSRKSVDKHSVSQTEAEQIFFSDPLLVVEDPRHSRREARFQALGRTRLSGFCTSPSPCVVGTR